jgi:hypothetical protein
MRVGCGRATGTISHVVFFFPASTRAQKTSKEPKSLYLLRLKNPGVEKPIPDHNKDGEMCLAFLLDWGYVDRRAANQLWALWVGCWVQSADLGWDVVVVTPVPSTELRVLRPVFVTRTGLSFCVRMEGVLGFPFLIPLLPAPSHPSVPWSLLLTRVSSLRGNWYHSLTP